MDEIPNWVLEPEGEHFATCRQYGKALTVFIAEDDVIILETDDNEIKVEGAKYQHDDHILRQFGGEAVRRAYETAREEIGNNDSAAYYEAALREIYEDSNLELMHLLVGVGLTDDRPYKVFGFMSDHMDIESNFSRG